ncbi:hypothetical protein GCM10027447_24870 [Glycomyces halotolerans]
MTTPNRRIVQAAARNNAAWCAAMSRSHGTASEYAAHFWAAPTRTPLFYPDAVTLAPGVEPAAPAALIDTDSPGASVKDSFADLDLREAGFEVLFEAQWIHRPAGPPASPSELAPAAVDDAAALREWALAWDDGNAGLFRPALLDEPDVFVIAGRSAGGTVAAGAVAVRSDGVVGVANVFARDGGPDRAWPVLLEALHRRFPGLPVVGYEHGEALEAAVRHGFAPVGPLRVWSRR